MKVEENPTIEQIKNKCAEILNSCKDDKVESVDFYKKNGFYFQECWNLDKTLAALILPRLIHYRNIKSGTPGCLCDYDENFNIINEEEGKEKWDKILNSMIEAFYRVIFADELYFDQEIKDYNEEKIEEGLSLFSKYFLCLWDWGELYEN